MEASAYISSLEKPSLTTSPKIAPWCLYRISLIILIILHLLPSALFLFTIILFISLALKVRVMRTYPNINPQETEQSGISLEFSKRLLKTMKE